jgi:hypothetical protein
MTAISKCEAREFSRGLQLWGSWLPGSGAWLLEQYILLVILTELDLGIVGYLAPKVGYLAPKVG